MADSKITALTSISTSTDPANDPLVIVDVSDTSMAATGTTKKVTLNQLLGASGTATLASATITGDLTVDTNTLKVDSANDVVLIGSATKATYGANKLEVRGASIADASLGGTNTGNLAILTTDSQAIDTGGVLSLGGGFNGTTPYMFAGISGRKETSANGIAQGYLQLFTTNVSNGVTERYRIGGDGVHTWRNVGGVAGIAMTLNSTGLGVGRTPSYKLDVAGIGNFDQLRINATSATKIDLVNGTTGVTYSLFNANSVSNGFNGFGILDGSSYVLRINTNGALVLSGGTVSASGVGIAFPATQVASSDANTLDDYVEGTFTPVIQGVSTAGTGVYTVQSGRYTKIGNRVFVDIFINWTAHTGTGAMLIANLPFTIKNASNYYPSVTFGQLNNIALAANSVLTGYGTFNTKTLNLDQYPVGGGATSSVQMDTSGSIVCSVCYEV